MNKYKELNGTKHGGDGGKSELVLVPLLSIVEGMASDDSKVVYLSRTGWHYHREDCGNWEKTREVSLREAMKEGYTPCSFCDRNYDN